MSHLPPPAVIAICAGLILGTTLIGIAYLLGIEYGRSRRR